VAVCGAPALRRLAGTARTVMNITCADDEAARSIVIALAMEIGFESVDADLGKLTCRIRIWQSPDRGCHSQTKRGKP
jgi:predicted dinucleotide-binding enzyme